MQALNSHHPISRWKEKPDYKISNITRNLPEALIVSLLGVSDANDAFSQKKKNAANQIERIINLAAF